MYSISNIRAEPGNLGPGGSFVHSYLNCLHFYESGFKINVIECVPTPNDMMRYVRPFIYLVSEVSTWFQACIK